MSFPWKWKRPNGKSDKMDMRIIVFSVCYNQADILPFFLRHYSEFADEISVWDDQSTDGSQGLLKANPKVILRDWPHPGSGISEDLFLNFAYEWYPKARGGFDWVIWVDPDEFIYASDVRSVLYQNPNHVIRTEGFNMIGDGLPKDDGRQIWEVLKTGVPASVYSKPVVFRPEVELKWNRGKHALEHCSGLVSYDAPLKLLHYRYLGAEYTRTKNAKNYDRCGGDKGAAWSCSPEWKGEHSPEWAELAKQNAVQVV